MKEIWPILVGVVIAMVIFTILWRQGAFLKLSGYFAETKEELKKCTWPTWEELTGSTTVVIVSVAVLGIFTFAVDTVVMQVIRLIV